LYDTYLLAMMAVQEVNAAGYVIKEENLVNELHHCIQEMYEKSQVNQLGSCLKDVIATALGKFTALGLLKARIYPSETGSHTTWLTSPKEQKEGIDLLYQQLTEVNSLSKDQLRVAGEAVNSAVEKSLVMHLSYPRL